MTALRLANLALLVVFPLAWSAPLMRAGVLPFFGLEEISILSGIAVLLESDPEGPVFPFLFTLNMLVRTDQGRAYSPEALMEQMAAAGLRNPHSLPFRGPQGNGIIVGKKGEEAST